MRDLEVLPGYEGEFWYFKLLTPREQLNDLVHKYAQINCCPYNLAWKALDEAWKAENGKALSLLRALEQKASGRKITLPQYIESAGLMERALDLAHRLIDCKILIWMNERAALLSCSQISTGDGRPDVAGPPSQQLFPL